MEAKVGLARSKRLEQGDATRLTLLLAGAELFGEFGYDSTSIDDVAARAGLTKGAIYHHFGGKATLFQRVVEQVMQQAADELATKFLEPDYWTALMGGCQLMIDIQVDPVVRRIVLVDARSVLNADVVRSIESRYWEVGLHTALRNAMQSAVIEQQPLIPLTVMLIGALREAAFYVATADDQAQARQDVGRLLSRMLEMLRIARVAGTNGSSDPK